MQAFLVPLLVVLTLTAAMVLLRAWLERPGTGPRSHRPDHVPLAVPPAEPIWRAWVERPPGASGGVVTVGGPAPDRPGAGDGPTGPRGQPRGREGSESA